MCRMKPKLERTPQPLMETPEGPVMALSDKLVKIDPKLTNLIKGRSHVLAGRALISAKYHTVIKAFSIRRRPRLLERVRQIGNRLDSALQLKRSSK